MRTETETGENEACRAVPPRSLNELLAPLDKLVQASPQLFSRMDEEFKRGSESYTLPRYRFIGPAGGDDPLRIGLFAGIHGDEPEGVHALVRFLVGLGQTPEVATGYCLFAYPVCNPTGFEARTRESRSGKDLNREFWQGSEEPEVQFLESELLANSLHGLISLHTDDTSHGFYGYARGATLTTSLIQPALVAAGAYLGLNQNDVIDGFAARNAVVRDTFPGVLSAPPKVRPRPFEIIFETPKEAPEYLKEAALVAALRTVLGRYREFLAYAPNL